jgi:hypothetical protein
MTINVSSHLTPLPPLHGRGEGGWGVGSLIERGMEGEVMTLRGEYTYAIPCLDKTRREARFT